MVQVQILTFSYDDSMYEVVKQATHRLQGLDAYVFVIISVCRPWTQLFFLENTWASKSKTIPSGTAFFVRVFAGIH